MTLAPRLLALLLLTLVFNLAAHALRRWLREVY